MIKVAQHKLKTTSCAHRERERDRQTDRQADRQRERERVVSTLPVCQLCVMKTDHELLHLCRGYF